MDPLGRRRILQAGLAVPFLPSLLGRRARAAVAAPPIRPRSDWGADLPPRGPLDAEAAGDVRFLLVHHSVSVNDYAAEALPEELRSFYRLHTAPEKGWADIAYNFLVDRFGVIWEGRTGSIEAPVKGDATGGSQGFAVLCCFIGDHRTQAPSAQAQASMVALLAWLAERHGIDPRPGTTTSFVSRGSNRWPAGASVTTTTIAGHRDMSKTVCPGDAAYHLVSNEFPARVAAAMGLPAAGAASPPAPATAAAADPTTTTTASPPQPAPTVTTTAVTPTTEAPATTSSIPTEVAGRPVGGKTETKWPIPIAAVVGAGALAMVIKARRRHPE